VSVAADPSFEVLMARLKTGDDDAATAVFRRFSHRLRGLARGHLEAMTQTRGEVEDVVQSVYKSFFSRFGRGEFAFDDWDDLWGLLTVITLRKCSNRRAYHRARRRDPRRLVTPSPKGPSAAPILQLIDREPTPLEAAILTDTLHELFRSLDEQDRETASLLMQGYTAEEIAVALACSERTVRRARGRLKERLRRMDEE
jgi:RNA polymerase sigma-70 factor (ECF subfamily)